MSSSTWNGNTGNWNDGTQWSDGVPGTGDSAVFNTGSSFTVTFDSTDQISGVQGFINTATFAVTGGDLQTGSWSWAGAFDQSGGTLDITGIFPVWSGSASISGGELIVGSGSGFPAIFEVGLTQSGGTIDIAAGTLDVEGTSSLDGSFTGAGVLDIVSGAVATFGNQIALNVAEVLLGSETQVTLTPGGTQDYIYNGNFLAGQNSTLNSTGQTFSLGAAGSGTFAGIFSGGGTLDVSGLYDLGGLEVTGAGGEVTVLGKALQDSSNVTLGVSATDSDELLIAQDGTYDNVGESTIDGNSLSAVDVAGVFIANAPAAATSIDVQHFTLAASGTLLALGNADLQLEGAGTGAGALLLGTVSGSGTLQIGGDEIASVGGTALDVAHLLIGSFEFQPGELLLTADQDYEGQLVNGAGTIDTNGFVFTLGSASDGTLGNVIDGGGTLLLAGSLELNAASVSGAELLVTGLAYADTSYLYLGTTGASSELSIGSTGTFDIANSNGVFGTGTAAVNNAGLIVLSGGAPFSTPLFSSVNFTNTGTIDIEIGALELSLGNATLGGLIDGPGTLWLDGDTVTVLAGLAFQANGLQWTSAHITLAADFNFEGTLVAGTGTTINTQGHTFTVGAGSLDATVTGGGTVVIGGPADGGPSGFNGGGIWLEGTGTTLLDESIFNADAGGLVLGEAATDSATLSITSTAQYIISDTGGISSQAGANSSIVNHGIFQLASIYPLGPVITVTAGTFDNFGTIIDSTGALNLVTSLVNDGLIDVSQQLQISGGVSADADDTGTFVIGDGASLGFTGAILTNPVPGSLVASSQIISFAGDTGVLTIENPALFAGTIEGFTAGDVINVGVVPDSTGAANAFSYGDNVLTLLSVTEISVGNFETLAVGTLALPDIDPANLQLFWNDVNGGMDIELSNPSTGDAPFFDGNVYNSTWNGPAGDDWNTAADWNTQYSLTGAPTNPQIENVVPFQGYDIVLPTALTLNYSAASTPTGEFTANDFAGAQGSIFDMTGGTLAVSYGFADGGLVNLSGGTLDNVSGNDGAFIDKLNLGAAGDLQVDDGTFDLSANGSSFFNTDNTIAGTLAGLGQINLIGGTYSIDSSADLSIATLAAGANAFLLEGDQVFNGQKLSNTAQFNLNGFDLLLPETSLLALTAGTVFGGGTITVAGSADLGGLITGNGTEILITGTAQTGYTAVELGTLIAMADLSSSIVVAAGGTYFNPAFIEPTGAWSGTLVNNGNIIQTSPETPFDEVGQQEQLGLFINAATATLNVEAGNMVFYEGSAQLDGLIEGGGTLELSAETATLSAAAVLDINNVVLSSTTLTLEGSQNYTGIFDQSFGDIDTNGYTLALGAEVSGGDVDIFVGGGSLGGDISGGGLVRLDGSYYVSGLSLSGAGTSLVDEHYIQIGSGGLQIGLLSTDTASTTIATGGEADFVSSGNISGNGLLLNAGLLEDSATALAQINAATFISTGTIDALYNELLVQESSAVIGGLVTGGGELYVDSLGTLTFSAGAMLNVASLALQSGVIQLDGNITYAGDLIAFNPTLNTNGFDLDLTGGGTLAGDIIGGGAITVAGALYATTTELWAANTTLDITGSLELSGPLYAGSTNASGAGAQLDIGTTGTLNLAVDGFLGTLGTDDNLTIDNAGLIEKTGALGVTSIASSVFINTGTILNDPGTIDIVSALVNNGTVLEEAGGSIIFSSISGTGVIIDDPSAITFTSAVAAGQTVSITGAGGTLALQDVSQFQGLIAGFQKGDIIDLTNIAPGSITGESFAGDVLTLDDASGNIELTFASEGYTGNPFTFGTDGSLGSYITTEQALCYLAGTRILTVDGEKPVEELAIGDMLVTRFGGIQPVKWIGRQSYDSRFILKNPEKIPVLIAAGALGNGLPARALSVSPGHSVLLGGVLVLAHTLVNGITITQPVPTGVVAYFNIEFGTHDCVLAEGIWAESYADAPGQRAQFHNAAEFAALYPDDEPAEQLVLCAERPEYGAALAAALRPVAARTATGLETGEITGYIDIITPNEIAGWAIDHAHPQLPLVLEIRLGDRVLASVLACDYRGDLAEAGMGRGRCAFSFTPREPLTAGELKRLQVIAPDGMALSLTSACHMAMQHKAA
jgi:Hint domain